MYKGLMGKIKQEQRLLNLQQSDLILQSEILPEFEIWFNETIEFGFGMGWMKPVAKKLCWYGYFAGYKKGDV